VSNKYVKYSTNINTMSVICGRVRRLKEQRCEIYGSAERKAHVKARTIWLVAIVLLCCASAVYGQSTSADRDVKAAPGREVRVGIYTSVRADCTAGPLPAIRLAVAPEHGTVTVRRAMLKATNLRQCLATELPAFVAFYRAQQNFSGDDRFELEVTFAAGRKQIQRFHVTLGDGANAGQRI
jgi:hypothetical protein